MDQGHNNPNLKERTFLSFFNPKNKKMIGKIVVNTICIITTILCIKTNSIFAINEDGSEITTQNNYIKNNELTYKKEENGETLISGFNIGEKVSEILRGRFGEDYKIQIKNSQGKNITNELNAKIGTGYKIELYSKNDETYERELEKVYTTVLYGDTNGDSNIGAVDALAIIKNKIGSQSFENIAQEEAGKVKQDTRITGVTPKADDALYIIKYKLDSVTYDIEQKMPGTNTEEKIENGNNIDGKINGTLTGADYNYNNPVIPVGFETIDTEDAKWRTKDGETLLDWNKGLTIQDKLGNQFVWIPVDGEKIKYEKNLAEENDENITTLENLKEDTYPSRIENETEQIEKYKGFYISKYEAGIPENMKEAIRTASKETRNVEGIPTSKKNQISWNYINYNTAKVNAEKMYQTKNVQSGLPTGTEWDVFMMWQDEKETYKPIISQLQEWTSETNEPYKIIRGERYKETPTAYRQKTLPEETHTNLGYRVVLYIQEAKIPAEVEEKITINVNSEAPRNTLKTGTQNGIETGPITVEINYGTTNLSKQYKKETDAEWTTIKDEQIIIEITENETILARYTDGKNAFKTTTKTIQNIDNIAPTIQKHQVTLNGTTITIEATATDEANEGAHPNIAGIVEIEYSIDGQNYQLENSFTVEKAGDYIVYTKAIDKAGNEAITQDKIKINEYQVTFDARGGVVTPTSKKVIQNTYYGELPIPTRTGYVFGGWYTANTNGTKIENLSIANIQQDQTLYANWIENVYTITLDNQNATTTGTTKIYQKYNMGIYKENQCTTKMTTDTNPITVPTRAGYTFRGYYEQTNGEGNQLIDATGKITNKLTTVKYLEDVTIYAKWTANTYTVNFDVNKGNALTNTSKTVTYDETYGELPIPTRTGYTFAGWYTEKTAGNEITNETTVAITSTQTLYAHWEAFTYIVTYDVNGGEDLEQVNKTVIYDSTYGELATPTREGYTFIGWYTETYGGTKIESTTKVEITEEQTIYARWQANNYTLTIRHYLENPNDDNYTINKTTEETITYGETVQLSNYKTSIQNGTYKFGKLTQDGEIIETTTMGTGATINLYYARDKYILNLNTGDNIETVTGIGNYKVGATVEINAILKPNPTGYTIKWAGWTSDDATLLTDQQVQNAEITMPVGNVTLTANAIKTPNKYTVSFEPTGGEVEPIIKEVTYDEIYGELPTPTKTGYTFAGWFTDETEGTKIISSTKVAITEEQTLYAHWTPNNYTLVIKHYLENANNDNYTKYSETTSSVIYNTPINLENYKTTVEGGTYKEGRLEENGTIAENTIMGTKTTIHLYYTRNKHTLTLNKGDNIETVTGEGLYKVGQEVEINASLKEEPTGYVLSWKNWTSGDRNLFKDNETQKLKLEMPNGDLTLTANAEKTPIKYQVSFNSNGGTVIPESKTVTYGENYGNLPIPEKEGHTFIGWYTEETLGTNIHDTTQVTTAEDHTLYAHWEVNSYALTIKHYLENANDDDFSLKATTTIQDIEYGSTLNLANCKIDLKDESNTIIGVYKEAKLEELGEAAETGVMGTDTVIHLYYTRKTYRLTLNKGENIEEVTGTGTYKVGQDVEINATLKKEGGYAISWAGWSNNDITTGTIGTQNLTLTMPSRDLTLTANAEKTPRTYTITYNANGGTTVTPTSKIINYNEPYGELAKTTKAGYDFKGWYTDITGGEKIESTTIFTSLDDQEIYARWEATNYILTVKHYLENANDEEYTYQEGKDTKFDVVYGTPITLEEKKTEITNGTYHHASIKEGGEAVETTTMGINTIIYLYYSRNTYELTLVEGEYIAEVTGAQTYKVGQTVRINATLEEDEIGYTNAWSKWISSDESLLSDNSTQNATIKMPAGNITLTAQGTRTANTYTVTFDTNGGLELDEENKTKTVTYDAVYGELPEPTREGHTFAGWFTSSEEGEDVTEVTSTTQVTITDEQTLYAHWTVNNYTLRVQHYLENANDGEYTHQEENDTYVNDVPYGTLITLKEKKTEITDGKTYDHASTTEGGEAEETTTMGIDTIIYLYYKRDTYELTLTPGEYISTVASGIEEELVSGEIKEDKVETYKVGQTVKINAELEDDDIEGYTKVWAGWTSSDTNLLNNNGKKDAQIEMPRGNVTLTANGKREANSYIVTFDVCEGDELENTSMLVTFDSAYGELPVPEKVGHNFIGWFKGTIDEAGEVTYGEEVTAGIEVKIADNHTIYAKWEPKIYSVTVMHYLENANDDDYTEIEPGEVGYYTFEVPYGTVLKYEDYAIEIENGTYDYGTK